MTVVITKPQREETETTGAQVWCRQALRQGKTFDAGCLMMKLLYCIPLVPLMYNIAERHHQPGSLFPCASLLQSSRLGVQVFVSFSGPIHKNISQNQWREPVEDLMVCAAICVKDGIFEGAGHGILSVRRHGVCDDSFLSLRPYTTTIN